MLRQLVADAIGSGLHRARFIAHGGRVCYAVAASVAIVTTNRENNMKRKMQRSSGLTLIQVMLLLLVIGLVGSFVVEALIDKRCESAPTSDVCKDRAQATKK